MPIAQTLRTRHGSIFWMMTIVGTPALEGAILQSLLIGTAVDIVHEYLTCSLSKVCTNPPISCSSEAQLSAYNVCVCDVPVVITHSAPLTIMEDFNSTFRVDTSIYKPHNEIYCVILPECMFKDTKIQDTSNKQLADMQTYYFIVCCSTIMALNLMPF